MDEVGGESSAGLVRMREGVIVELLAHRPGATEALARIGQGQPERVLSYHDLTGPLRVGDRVVLNTTALHEGLGTGGLHFVCAVYGRCMDSRSGGHIMKARYTPSQVKVLSVEEEMSPYRQVMETIPDLGGMPVLVGSLHSQVPIVAAVIRHAFADARIAYVMTDGGALPLALSRIIPVMRESGLINIVITAGHAFGGDYEAVCVPSALAAAHQAAQADVTVVAMGPGVVGTGTPLGTTALEVGPILDAATALGATPIAVVRASLADGRARHRGISHHTITALSRFTFTPVHVPLTRPGSQETGRLVHEQAAVLTARGHTLWWEDGKAAYTEAKSLLDAAGLFVQTMGRSDDDDPYFFWTAAAAGAFAVRRMRAIGKANAPIHPD